MLLMRLGRAATAQEVVRHDREASSLEVLDLRPPVHHRCAGAVHEDHDVARPAVDESAGAMVDSKDPPRPHLHTLGGQRRLRLLEWVHRSSLGLAFLPQPLFSTARRRTALASSASAQVQNRDFVAAPPLMDKIVRDRIHKTCKKKGCILSAAV
jgi:hypothetical protein